MTDPTDPTDPTEPTGTTDATGPTEPTDPVTPPPAPAPPPGASSTPSWPQPGTRGGGMSGQDQRNWAMGAHLSALVLAFFGGLAVLGPLVVYLIKKDEDKFVAEHSREALNFQLTWLIGGFVFGVLAVIGALLTIGIGLIVIVPLAIGLFVAWLVFTIKAGMAASRGEYYRYPMTVRMVS